MPPANSIHLRAFELRAGPKAARLVTVSLDRSIADVYAYLCRVLKMDAPLHGVTFHKTRNKNIDTTPLPIAVPIGTLGLADNDIFIIRQVYRAGSVAREEYGSTQRNGETQCTSKDQQRQLEQLAAPPSSAEASPRPQGGTEKPSSVAQEMSPQKEVMAATPTASLLEGTINAERNEVRVTTDVQRLDRYQRQCAQHSQVTQAFVLKLFQVLAVLSRVAPTVPLTAPQRGSTRWTTSISDLHRELLNEFCRRSGLSFRHVNRLVGSGNQGVEAVYEALYYYADVTIQNNAVRVKVDEFLKERLPQLQPAARMICVLYEGHEAEYLERVLLRLIGRVPTAMAWLCLRDSAAIAYGKKKCCYYSAVTNFSQAALPLHVTAAEIPVLETAELDSCCVAWGLNNSSYRGHLFPLSCWMWSRLVAAVLTGHNDASARLCDLLNTYGEYEASLAWVA